MNHDESERTQAGGRRTRENSIEPGLVIMHPNRATSVLCEKFPKNFLIHPPRTKTTSERGPPFSMRGAFVVALVRWPA